jgi:ankyrin repeat protein
MCQISFRSLLFIICLAAVHIATDEIDPRNVELLRSCYLGNFEGVSRAISSGASVEVHDSSNGYTPLIWASFGGHIDIMSSLIEKGASTDSLCSNGLKTPLLAAAFSGKASAVELLLHEGALVNLDNSRGDTALILASYAGNTDTVEALLRVKKNTININAQNLQNRHTALHLAAFNGNEDIINMLVDAGAALNIQDAAGLSPLMLAAVQGNEGAVKTLSKRDGANLELRDAKSGSTALMLAAESGDMECLHALLDAGADIETTSNAGQTSLMRAAVRGNVAVVKALLIAGAAVDTMDRNGMNAADLARAHSQYETVTLLEKFSLAS